MIPAHVARLLSDNGGWRYSVQFCFCCFYLSIILYFFWTYFWSDNSLLHFLIIFELHEGDHSTLRRNEKQFVFSIQIKRAEWQLPFCRILDISEFEISLREEDLSYSIWEEWKLTFSISKKFFFSLPPMDGLTSSWRLVIYRQYFL